LWIGTTCGGFDIITAAGTIEFIEFINGFPFGSVEGITLLPDANLWAALDSGIAKVDLVGIIVLYTLPQPSSGPYGIVPGPDGNVWFTERNGNQIAKITPSGAVTEYPIPSANSMPRGIAVGPDGNLWFAELAGNRIGKLAIAGTPNGVPMLSRSTMLILIALLLSCGLAQLHRRRRRNDGQGQAN
jgi:virginiamycin B lyase